MDRILPQAEMMDIKLLLKIYETFTARKTNAAFMMSTFLNRKRTFNADLYLFDY